ncbi:MAG: prepilin peptidase [Alphaproteobacteria bacterium]|nr:prepilin peptidase [Alphaproteobacteria bacterium]
MVFVFLTVFCVIVALGFGAASSWSDFMRMSIPNNYVVAVVLSFIPAFLLLMFFVPEADYFSTWVSHLLGGVIVFVVTYALFHFGLIGGGDAKLLSAYGLWVGLAGLMPFLFFMALMGGILGVVTLYLNKNTLVKAPVPESWIDKAQKGEKKVPYGGAIFVGAVVAFWQLGYIQPENLIELASAETRLG